MIDPTQKRISLVFLATLLASYFCFGGANIFFMYISAVKAAETHIKEHFEFEFVQLYQKEDFATLNHMVEDECYQLLDKNGKVIFAVDSIVDFIPDFNHDKFEKALTGKASFEIAYEAGELYMTGYLPFAEDQVARVTIMMESIQDTAGNYIKFVVMLSPFFVLLVFIISWYLVRQSLKPILTMSRYQETFSSNINHELNSPLTAVKGNLEITLKKQRQPEEYKSVLRSSLKSINEIINLLQNLHLLSMSKFKPADLYMEENDIGMLLNEIIEQYEPPIYAKQLSLDILVPVGINCWCDYFLIRRVLENIISNAIKYSLDKVLLQIRLARSGDQIIISLINNGLPIDNKELLLFFEPFYRGKEVGKLREDGKGLGLFISRYIVESHGGTLTMKHDNGVFTVIVMLPEKNTLDGGKIKEI